MAKQNTKLAEVFHFDLQGKREEKFEFLNQNSLASIQWNKLESNEPNFFFVEKNFDGIVEYEKGIKVDELFLINTSGVKTHNDGNLISIQKFQENNHKYYYRPFDIQNIEYNLKKVVRHRFSVMKHLLKENIAILFPRQAITEKFGFFVSKGLTDINYTGTAGQFGAGLVFPLYLYPETNAQQTIGQASERTPNLNAEIVQKIAEKLGLTFAIEKNSPPLEGCPKDGVVVTTINSTPIIRNFIENLPHNPALNQLAKDKRKAGILSEVLFWQQVHKGHFHNIDFDRQRIVGNYIVDFYVKTLGLVIEIDGSSHDEKAEYDAERLLYLENLGLKVYRIADIDVKKNIGGVIQGMENYIIQEYGGKTTPSVGHPSEGGEFAPIDILDYIYAVLHSPTYRKKYKEFLKIDFPRVPYPKDKDTFWQLVKLGGEIRQIHLLESPTVEKYITQYPIDGDNVVIKPNYQNGKVYINDTQFFDNVPQIAWEFYIGGYQPAQKWLKDRKERTLEFDDILHYQKIIVALSETDRLMKEIDKIEIE